MPQGEKNKTNGAYCSRQSDIEGKEKKVTLMGSMKPKTDLKIYACRSKQSRQLMKGEKCAHPTSSVGGVVCCKKEKKAGLLVRNIDESFRDSTKKD